jgi:hypothetical protein
MNWKLLDTFDAFYDGFIFKKGRTFYKGKQFKNHLGAVLTIAEFGVKQQSLTVI